MVKRRYVTYDLKQGKRVVYREITNNPERRVEEHKESGKRFTHMQVTSRRMNKLAADRREDRALSAYRRHHSGRNPRYNKDDDG